MVCIQIVIPHTIIELIIHTSLQLVLYLVISHVFVQLVWRCLGGCLHFLRYHLLSLTIRAIHNIISNWLFPCFVIEWLGQPGLLRSCGEFEACLSVLLHALGKCLLSRSQSVLKALSTRMVLRRRLIKIDEDVHHLVTFEKNAAALKVVAHIFE